MPRVRISTTVNDTLLDQARSTLPDLNDAALLLLLVRMSRIAGFARPLP